MLVASIDIMGGKAVQLKQGRDLIIESDKHPLDLAIEFNRYGEVAVIDLDAAMGKGNNQSLIRQICRVCDARVGGGIRDVDTAKELLKAGAKQLIFGTKAEPEILSKLPKERLMVALDHRSGEVVDHGWQHATGETVWQRAERLTPYCGSFLATFVEGEGCLGGMNVAKAMELKERLEHPVTVAGGIASTEEVIELSKQGLDVQVGMALYKGLIDLKQSVIGAVKFSQDGLIPTVVQDKQGNVLMVAYSSVESLGRALAEGKGVYYSRSRKEIWEKGATSGHRQKLISCRVDCDRDTLLFTVQQEGAACHTGSYSCFNPPLAQSSFVMEELFQTLKERKSNPPAGSYSAKLFRDREELMKKIMEEASEVVSYRSRENLRWEIADVLFFLSVLAVDEGIEWAEVEAELGERRR